MSPEDLGRTVRLSFRHGEKQKFRILGMMHGGRKVLVERMDFKQFTFPSKTVSKALREQVPVRRRSACVPRGAG
jgi:hypothetical protein